ncbi:hypothetical protein [Taibaiella chishuiensis]|uniref:Uncharacterized protein n=1 Tax=Taibaiella chishuiensis TaxID=1434707 RepID=A0A2P8CVL1_9BACT|nr:hypothetical protein [Taibaiella chishuiensis]PSK89007.1 hypothetical protein B0I18_11318 [Taibaiella chishuiensis]
MNFSELKAAFFNKPKLNKVDLLKLIKTNSADVHALEKFVTRVEKEIPILKATLNKIILGENSHPKSYNDLGRGRLNFYSETLEKEMQWQMLGFIRHAAAINDFVKRKERFEFLLLSGNYEVARTLLDEIDEQNGYTLWSIEHRFILDEYEFGTEKNWETRNLVVNDANDMMVQILGNLYSVKAEKKVSFFQFNEITNDFIEQQKLNAYKNGDSYSEYFRFKTNYFSSIRYNHLSYLVYMEEVMSVIDRYLMSTRILQELITRQELLGFVSTFVKRLLTAQINDKNLFQIAFLFIDDYDQKPEQKDVRSLAIIDQYTVGNYQQAFLMAKQFLSENGCITEIVEIYAKSAIEGKINFEKITDQDSILNSIVKCYYDVFNKDKDATLSYIELLKLSTIFNNSALGVNLYAFVSGELSWPGSIDYELLGMINSAFINPRLSLKFRASENLLDHFLNQLCRLYPSSPTVQTYIELCTNQEKNSGQYAFEYVPTLKRSLYKNRSLLHQKNYSNCIDSYEQLLVDDEISILSKFEIVTNLFECYLAICDYQKALNLFVDTHLKNPALAGKMSHETLLEILVSAKYKCNGDKINLISLPIFFKINCSDKIKVKQTYELFLRSHNNNTPRDLIAIASRFPKTELVYFLSTVCSTEIMQLSKAFNSTYAVNEERISICKFLAEFDTQKQNSYQVEIAELTQKNTISNVIGGIDERKIFVNESKIKELIKSVGKQNVLQNESLSPLTNEAFERYVQLFNYIRSKKSYRDFRTVFELNDNGEIKFLEMPENIYSDVDVEVVYLPAFRIFAGFFLYIRDLFVSSKEFGLDAYISTRIRHGTLPNHLRSVFETYSLVTSQTDNVYAENEFWKEKLVLAETLDAKLQSQFSQFSLNIDTLSKDIKDKYIQCAIDKRAINTEPLFEYSYTESELILLFAKDFVNIVDLDSFIERCFNELWRRTEHCLSVIRQQFNVQFKDKYVAYIDELHSNILAAASNKQAVSELTSSLMTCRTEIQTKLNNISEWFRRSESSFDGKYDLQILAEASIQIAKNIHPNFPFEVEKQIDSFYIKGEYHQHFIDLMNNILFNVIKHCSLPHYELHAKMSIMVQNDILELRFENNVLNSNSHEAKLEMIKANWYKPDANIRQEGGTGFPKIKKILNADLNRKASKFDYSCINNKVEIAIDFETKDLQP